MTPDQIKEAAEKPQIEKAATSSSQKCTLSDAELIAKCDEWISKLCKTGGRAWVLSVPVQLNNDPDVLLSTMMNRFKALSLSKPEKEDEWISCETRLPEYNQKVLVLGEQSGMNPQMGGAYVSISERISLPKHMQRDSSKFMCENGFKMMRYVTHWMPLPSPPNPK